jgi:hypothetical protein
MLKFPGFIVPQLPMKTALAKLSYDKPEFFDQRKRGLEQYLQKILGH